VDTGNAFAEHCNFHHGKYAACCMAMPLQDALAFLERHGPYRDEDLRLGLNLSQAKQCNVWYVVRILVQKNVY